MYSERGYVRPRGTHLTRHGVCRAFHVELCFVQLWLREVAYAFHVRASTTALGQFGERVPNYTCYVAKKNNILGHGTVHVPRWFGVDYVANLGCTVAENVVMSLSRLRRRLVSRAARDAS